MSNLSERRDDTYLLKLHKKMQKISAKSFLNTKINKIFGLVMLKMPSSSYQ